MLTKNLSTIKAIGMFLKCTFKELVVSTATKESPFHQSDKDPRKEKTLYHTVFDVSSYASMEMFTRNFSVVKAKACFMSGTSKNLNLAASVPWNTNVISEGDMGGGECHFIP